MKLQLALGIAALVALGLLFLVGIPTAMVVGQHRVDVERCAGGPPEEKTDLAKYRVRLAECERFYAEGKVRRDDGR